MGPIDAPETEKNETVQEELPEQALKGGKAYRKTIRKSSRKPRTKRTKKTKRTRKSRK